MGIDRRGKQNGSIFRFGILCEFDADLVDQLSIPRCGEACCIWKANRFGSLPSIHAIATSYPKESVPAGSIRSIRKLKLGLRSPDSIPLRTESQDAERRTFSTHPSRREDNTSPPKSIASPIQAVGQSSSLHYAGYHFGMPGSSFIR
jgi:hypothetical protein